MDGDAGGVCEVPCDDTGGLQGETGRGLVGVWGGKGELYELPCAAHLGGDGAMKRERSVGRLMSDYMSLALILPVSLLVGYGIGLGLDHVFGTHFWYIVWLIAGVVAGMRELIRKAEKEMNRE